MIYLLMTIVPYEGGTIHGAYTTKEKAAIACAQMQYSFGTSMYDCDIVEVNLNDNVDANIEV